MCPRSVHTESHLELTAFTGSQIPDPQNSEGAECFLQVCRNREDSERKRGEEAPGCTGTDDDRTAGNDPGMLRMNRGGFGAASFQACQPRRGIRGDRSIADPDPGFSESGSIQ